GGEDDEFEITLHPEANPRAIDLTAKKGPLKGKTALGIYKLEGDELRLCLPGSPTVTERPTNFVAPADSDLLLLRVKRLKGGAAAGAGASKRRSPAADLRGLSPATSPKR